MLGSPLASKKWSEADRKLAHAMTIDKLSRCPCGCGGYADVTLEDDGQHNVQELRCDARAALQQAERDSDEQSEPGIIRVPVRGEVKRAGVR